MTLDKITNSYNELIKKESSVLSRCKKKIFQIGSIRLIIVLAACAISYFLWAHTVWVAGTIIAAFVLFLALLKVNNKLQIRKKYSELKIQNAENELKGLNYDFTAFDGAIENQDANHSYSYDLDLFGNRSFFQSLNRTVTKYGKEKLIDTMLYPPSDKQTIIHQQDAAKELSQNISLLHHFRATGQMSGADTLDIKKLIEIFVNTSLHTPLRASWWRFMLYIMPCLAAGSILLCVFDLIPVSLFVILWLVLIIISCIPLKKIKNNMALWNKSKDSLETYAQLLKLVEENAPASPIFNKIGKAGSNEASKAIAELSKHLDNFNQTFTIPGIFILSPTLLWSVRYSIKIEEWVFKHQEEITNWFNSLSQFDSYVSMAIYTYNHPQYVFPTVSDTYRLEAKQLGHPMLHRDVCVRNDVDMAQHPFFLVVTGANMAGKSTYLRTVGLNLIVASMGLPVWADQLEFYPFQLVTNLRTSDSLADSESYFFAELKRLKMIIDRLQNGEQLFIILDEILKGTNSEDKQKGSIALMKQLIAQAGCGIIATHDLILGNLESEYKQEVKNYRFEADITNEKLTFSYRIREGVAQNMNACFLMKKMGITGL